MRLKENSLLINYSNKANKFFEKHSVVKDKFISNLDLWLSGVSVDIKKLKGMNNIYRMRINKYRVIYMVSNNGDITIIDVIDDNVYKHL